MQSGQKGFFTDWEWVLPAQGKYLPRVCLVQAQGLGEGAELHWGNSQLQPAQHMKQLKVQWESHRHLCHAACAPCHSWAHPRAGEGNSCQSWPPLPTVGLTVLPFPPAPENIITKQSYTTSKWNQKEHYYYQSFSWEQKELDFFCSQEDQRFPSEQ